MKQSENAPPFMRFLFHAAVFIVSLLSVSNLMGLLLQASTEGITTTERLLLVGYAFVSVVTVAVLARAIYQLDKRAGRIRNRVELFE
jgi:hypothetical protein